MIAAYKNKILIIFFLFCIFSQITLANTEAQKFSVIQKNNQDQFIFELSQTTDYNIFSLPSPARIVLDLNDTQNNIKINKSIWQNTLVKNVRIGTNVDGTLRIVLDLKKNVKFKTARINSPDNKLKLAIYLPAQIEDKKNILPTSYGKNFIAQGKINDITGSVISKSKTANNLHPLQTNFHAMAQADADQRAILDIHGHREQKSIFANLLHEFSVSNQPEKKTVSKREVVSLVPKPDLPLKLQQKPRDIIVVIDPGHGGKDPGVSSIHGIREKNIVLTVAKDLRQQLNQEFGIKAILTRSGDYFLPLKERLKVARDNHADLFVSIHADAYKKNSSIKGVSIFALSANGATSESARWLAEKENESEAAKTSDKNMLQSILLDFTQKTTIQSSLDIAKLILLEFPSVAKLHTHRIEQASFVVLKSPNIPSLLIEVGFLSDFAEESSLQDAEYDNKLAYAIKQGIVNYFAKNPPQGTYLASIKNNE